MATETKNEVTVSHKSQPEKAELPATPATPMFGPLEEMEHLFDRLMPRTWMRPMVWNWPLWRGVEEMGGVRMPQIDVIDHDQEILIRVEMPGVDKKDIHVSVNNSTLNISGSINREMREQKKDYVRCEIAQGNFSRSLPIPEGVVVTRIEASFKDGILEVTLPKDESALRRAVTVK